MTNIFLICIYLIIQSCVCVFARSKKLYSPAIELTATNLTSNLHDWNSDLAIMFYAPWCKYCKQLAPTFDQIAAVQSKSKDLAVGKFNCEVPSKHADICKQLGVDRYPSVYFVGYGDFNQAADGNFLGKSTWPNVVRFTADMYPEAILDWISMLAQFSHANRKWDDLKGIFTGRGRQYKKQLVLQEQVEALQSKLNTVGTELSKFKANDIFDSLTDYGDPFPLLQSAPDESNYVLRICVVEMAGEYCRYASVTEEPYCSVVEQCNKKDMTPEACRPAVCPFTNPRGCAVVSQCLAESVMAEYKRALGVTAE